MQKMSKIVNLKSSHIILIANSLLKFIVPMLLIYESTINNSYSEEMSVFLFTLFLYLGLCVDFTIKN